ncbi:type 2 lanthipeptide synthetase LanM family protein [Haliangium sp.]|uniref:type 2 lanthipeptide synthetase LanM family protein n=1 Tax=Haliangium sp. TaxID=2663208 RepID=UPI003D14869C
METTPDQLSDWHAAHTLAERVAFDTPLSAATGPGYDDDSAAFRLSEWEELFAFRADEPVIGERLKGLFERRLRRLSLTREQFQALLGETLTSLEQRAKRPPAWVDRFVSDLTDGLDDGPDGPLPGGGTTDGPAPAGAGVGQPSRSAAAGASGTDRAGSEASVRFLTLVKPLVRRAVRRFRADIDALLARTPTALFDTDTAARLFAPALRQPLGIALQATLVLELNVARLEGELSGDTPGERFEQFIAMLATPAVRLRIFREYPVLARLVQTKIEHWRTCSLELCERLVADQDLIRARIFADEDPGRLSHIEVGRGDRHRGGRTVTRLEFDSGARLIYKPRSLAPEVIFQELLRWLDHQPGSPGFRTFAVIDRGDYGWTEFVRAAPCDDRAQVERFYRRQGASLAILHALNAADMHFENVIACGEYPVIVDGETLLHVHLWDEFNPDAMQDKPVAEALLESVMRIGLLPNRAGVTDDYDGYDLGGLSARPEQVSMIDVEVWAGAGTDEMHADYQRVVGGGGNNLPVLDGAPVEAMAFRDHICAGFADTYRLLVQHRARLLDFVDRFAGTEIRVLIRATRVYALLLAKSRHPDFLRDGLDRDLVFERLWTLCEGHERLMAVVPHEILDLHDDCVPLFTMDPATTELRTSRGVRIPDYFSESCLDQVRGKIERLSERDLERQLWFVRASFSALVPRVQMLVYDDERAGERAPAAAAAADLTLDPEAALAVAERVGARVAEMAILGPDAANWVGVHAESGSGGSIRLGIKNAELPLYSGLPGISLFLARLAAQTGRADHRDLAERAFSSLRKYVAFFIDLHRRARPKILGNDRIFKVIGGFSGWAGILYAYTHVRDLWGPDIPSAVATHRGIDDDITEMVTIIDELVDDDHYLDVIGGAAGAIPVLLGLDRVMPGTRALATAVHCGEHLAGQAQPQAAGLGWPRKDGGVPLTGFAHGAAGVAWALLELAASTAAAGHPGHERFREVAVGAIAYERGLFSPERRNWPDLRALRDGVGPDLDLGQAKYTAAWCHGATGVGLARLASLDHLDDGVVREEIEVAIATTLVRGFGHNHSLCHGDLGNLELLALAAERLGGDDRRRLYQATAAGIVADIDARGGICGLDFDIDTPCLMTGLAGIGYGLLRLAAPAQVPSMLLLAPPATTTH